MKKLIYTTITGIFFVLIFSGIDCDDGTAGGTPVPTRCVWVEVDEMAGYTYWNSSVASRTFSQAAPDQTVVGVCVIDNVTLGITAVSYSTTSTNECNINQFLEAKTQRTWEIQGYNHYIFFAKDCSIGGGGYLFGKSSRSSFCYNTNNFSFVFCQTIKNTGTSGWNVDNVMNAVTVHELGGHQISNTWGHIGHNGKDPDYCYLNDYYNTDFVNHYFATTTQFTSFEICPNHKTALWNGPDLILTNDLSLGGNGYESTAISNKSNKILQSDSESKLNITIELSKKIYKMYEPIHAVYKIVNKSNTIDTICQEFVEYHNFIDYSIENLNENKTYSQRNVQYDWNIVPRPMFFLQPGDTLYISKRINFNYGEKFANNENIFEENGYLKPGKYKVNSTINFRNIKYKTGNIEFEVVPLTDQDNQIIDFSRNKNFPTEYNNFGSNVLIEPLLAQELFEYYPDYSENYTPTREDIMLKYGNFLELFPDSKYWNNILFINSLFYKLAYTNSDIRKDIEYIQKNYKNSALIKYLNMPSATSYIYEITDELKKSLHNK